VLRDRGRAGKVRLDHLHIPGVAGGDAVPVEEPLDIGEQEAMLGGELRDATVKGVETLSQLDHLVRRQTELAPSQLVVAVARVIDCVDDDPRTERLEPLCDLVKPAKDRVRRVAAEKVVAAGGQRHDIGGGRCSNEVCEHVVCGVAVNREIEKLETELAGKLRCCSPTIHAGVGVDRHAVTNGQVDAHAGRMALSATRSRTGAPVRACDRVRSNEGLGRQVAERWPDSRTCRCSHRDTGSGGSSSASVTRPNCVPSGVAIPTMRCGSCTAASSRAATLARLRLRARPRDDVLPQSHRRPDTRTAHTGLPRGGDDALCALGDTVDRSRMLERLAISDDLLLKIARCKICVGCKTGRERPTHPCQRVVGVQAGVPLEEHHLPEPWSGHLASAPILFVSSNPSINTSEDYPQWGWTDAGIVDFFDNRFGGGRKAWVTDGARSLRADGTRSGSVALWAGVRNRAGGSTRTRGAPRR
jgi:hypothetical protein